MLSCLCRTWHKVLVSRDGGARTPFSRKAISPEISPGPRCAPGIGEGSFDPGISVYRKLERLGLLARQKPGQKQRLRLFDRDRFSPVEQSPAFPGQILEAVLGYVQRGDKSRKEDLSA